MRALRFRNELLALAGMLLALQLLPRRPGVATYVLGLATAAPLAVAAVAIVLVYRTDRFMNFAQLTVAVTAGVVFISLVKGQLLLNVVRSACGCIGREPGTVARTLNFAVAVVLSVGFATAITWLGYATILRRFRRGPRIMLMLATVFMAQALAGFQPSLQQLIVGYAGEAVPQRVSQRSTTPPGDFALSLGGGSSLPLRDILLLGAAVLLVVGLTLYLKRSATGVSIRASGESPALAETLGIDAAGVSSRMWAISGVLAGVAGTISAFGGNLGSFSGEAIPAEDLALILAAAVAARFSSLPMVGVAAATLGIVRLAMQNAFASTLPMEVATVFVVGGLLLLQRSRRRGGTREETSSEELTREVRPVPRELRGLPQVRTWTRVATGLSALIVLALPWTASPTGTSELSTYVLYAIIGLSVLVLTGWAGQVSLGQMGFAAIGAWVVAWTQPPLPLGLVLGGAAGALASVLVAFPALKLTGLQAAVSTLALAISANALFLGDRYLGKLLPDALRRPSVLGMKFDDVRVFYYFSVFVTVCCCVAVVGLRRSRTGRALIAIRANEPAAETFGISPLKARLTAFGIAGFLAGLAGAMLALYHRDAPPAAFTAQSGIETFMFAVMGGMGTTVGPILGAAYMAGTRLLSDNPLITYTASGTGALLLLMSSPGGLANLLADARDAGLRRLAVRLRISVPSLLGDARAGHVLDRAPLEADQGRGPRSGVTTPLVYRLSRQWALDRYGSDDHPKERVGG